MFNRPTLAVNGVMARLLTKLLFSVLPVTILLTSPTLTQADTHLTIACKNDIVTHFTQKNNNALSPNEQQRSISCMMVQLQQYQQQEYPARQQYLAYKAQAWLNYAHHQASTNSKTTTGRHAFQEGSNILTALNNGTDEQINLTPDIPKTSALMRPDLWATLNALKNSGGIALAPRELAFSEVTLVWAAAEQCAQGWQQSGTHFRMSERWLEQAREAYVNAHTSKENVALEERINRYFKQYESLDTGEDKCQGQVFPNTTLRHSTSIPMPIPTATYKIVE